MAGFHFFTLETFITLRMHVTQATVKRGFQAYSCILHARYSAGCTNLYRRINWSMRYCSGRFTKGCCHFTVKRVANNPPEVKESSGWGWPTLTSMTKWTRELGEWHSSTPEWAHTVTKHTWGGGVRQASVTNNGF